MSEKSVDRERIEKSSPMTREEMYRGKKIIVRKDSQNSNVWDVVIHPGSIVLIPVMDDGKILFIKQWRHVVDQILIELPAGTLEKSEEPMACAEREIQEETGYRAGKITFLGGFYSAPGYTTEYLHLFLAEELEPSFLPADEDEGIDVFPLTLLEAQKMIKTGKICDAKTLAGIHRYAASH